MRYLTAILTVSLQFIAGYLFVFLGALVILGVLVNSLGLVGPDNTNPWWNTPLQFAAIALAGSLGIWLVGLAGAELRELEFEKGKAWWSTLAGSAIGILIIAVIYIWQGAVSFMPVVFALIGGLTGYHLQPRIWK